MNRKHNRLHFKDACTYTIKIRAAKLMTSSNANQTRGEGTTRVILLVFSLFRSLFDI